MVNKNVTKARSDKLILTISWGLQQVSGQQFFRAVSLLSREALIPLLFALVCSMKTLVGYFSSDHLAF